MGIVIDLSVERVLKQNIDLLVEQFGVSTTKIRNHVNSFPEKERMWVLKDLVIAAKIRKITSV